MSRRLGRALFVTVLGAAALVPVGAGSAGKSPTASGAVVFDGDAGIEVANLDGTGLALLASDTSSYHDYGGPVWSPDAKRIAFHEDEGTTYPSVWVMKADGSERHQIGSGSYPEWSRDGTRIAYELHAERSSGEGLAIVNSATRRTTRVRVGEVNAFSWSPDGMMIVYAVSDDKRVWVYDLARGASRVLARASTLYDVEWSPDGSAIAVDDDAGIQLLDPSTGRLRTLVSDGGGPVWSPTGDRLAFVRDRKVEGLDLMTIRRDGGDEKRVTTVDRVSASSAPYVSWTGDERTLVFARARTGDGSDIWRLGVDGRDAAPITRAFPTGFDFQSPAWAPITIPVRPERAWPAVAIRPSRMLAIRDLVDGLAADGHRATLVPGESLRPALWSAAGAFVRLGADDCNYAVVELAFTRGRAAWTCDSGGAPPTIYLETATIGPAASGVDFGFNDNVENLTANDGLIAFNTRDEDDRLTVWRLAGGAWKRLFPATSPDAGPVLAVGDGRIAVSAGLGRIVFVDDRGKRLSALRLRSSYSGQIRLTGPRLVVFTGPTIDVRDATTGALQHRWPTAPTDWPYTRTLEDARGDLAVYAVGIALHVIRLSDGRDRVLSIPREQGPVHADLAPEGLYYSYTAAGSSKPGRVAFVPIRRLVAALAADLGHGRARPTILRPTQPGSARPISSGIARRRSRETSGKAVYASGQGGEPNPGRSSW